jgi:large subunit ribosomal protein L22
MITAISTQKYIRMSPRKLRLVADLARPLTPEKALEVLPYLGKRAADPIYKVIKSAVANAEQKGANLNQLIFSEIQINEGPRLKRAIAVSRGMSHPITKPMSHIRVVVKTQEVAESEEKSKPKEEVKVEEVKPKVRKEKKA